MKTTLTRLLTSPGIKIFGLIGILFSLAQIGNAQSPTTPALGFNVFVKNTAKLSTNKTDGPIAIGTDLTLNGNATIAAQSAGTFKSGSTTIGLLIGGRIHYQSGNESFVNNGYVKIGDATGSTVFYKDTKGVNSNLRITGGNYSAKPSIQLQTSSVKMGVSAINNPVLEGGLIDFSKAFSALQSNSKIVAAMATNIEFTNPNGDRKGTTISSVLTGGQVKVNLKNKINVINTTGTELNNVSSNIIFNNAPDASHVLVINVDAVGTFNWKVWTQVGLGFENCPFIIYNFFNTTTLNIEGDNTVAGTVLAPLADIRKTASQSNIEGQVIALSYENAGGENHFANFNSSLKESDVDGDGIPDAKDHFPSDAAKAFNNLYPSTGMSTLMYEDLWPFKGDYDFNDLVIDYRFNTVTDASNNVVQIEYKFLPKASGALAKNGFAFQLDGINENSILSVTGSKMTSGWTALNSNGTEAGQSINANVIVFDYANKVFNGSALSGTVNTFPNLPFHPSDTITIVVKFQPGSINFATLSPVKFNPYLIVDQIRGREIHLPNKMPSAKLDVSYFGKGDDNSNPATGRYYKTKNNLPWALEITSTIPYAREMADFSKAYTKFIQWGESKGTIETDWYLNKPGNRVSKNLYVK